MLKTQKYSLIDKQMDNPV